MSIEDLAQEVELRDWEQRNNFVSTKRTFEPGERGYGPAQCVECEDDMPPQRRAMGSTLCTACKTLEEKQQALRR